MLSTTNTTATAAPPSSHHHANAYYSPATHGRIDVLQFKTELATLLGPKKDAYWKALKSFIRGALKRKELDSIANEILGTQHGT